MTRGEFLDKLRLALGNDLSGSIIQENVNYYDNYINEEVRKGRSEAEVIDELGDPWVIARTIIDSVENRKDVSNNYGSGYESYGNDEQSYGKNVHAYRLDSGWKRLLLVLGLIGILVLIVAVVGGLISLLAPILIPLLIVMIIIRILGNRWS